MARKPGRLLLMGGGDRRDPDYKVLRYFVEEAGGKNARLLLLGVASSDPEQTLEEYEDLFKGFGAAEVWTDPLHERSDAAGEEVMERLKRSTATFLMGGDQLRITTVLAGTELGEGLRARNDAGSYLIAGTSAGAAAMGSVMILDGKEGGTVRRADVQVGPGLGYIRDAVVDTHFNERGRDSRLLTIFAQNSQILGLGIDADTALDVQLGSRYDVIGHGCVTVFNGRVSFSNAARVDETMPLALSGVQLHVLVDGYGFDPKEMKIITPYAEYEMQKEALEES